MWQRSRVIDIIWTNILYDILNNEWELKFVYQQDFPLRKKLVNVWKLRKS